MRHPLYRSAGEGAGGVRAAGRPAAITTSRWQTRASEIYALFAGTALIARSAIAVIVSDGFTPGFADTLDPSMT